MSRREAAAVAALCFAVSAVYLLRIDHAAGPLIDDAWYMVLGKGLAEGQGYRLTSSATDPIVPAVPPGFPLLLSVVFWLRPSFPDNVILMKLLSVLAMGGVGMLCYFDFTRHRGLRHPDALLLAAAVTITPALVFLATSSVMAECVFTLLQLAGVVLLERAQRAPSAKAAIAAAAVAAAAILVRTAGVALPMAGVVWLFYRGRRKTAVIFAVTTILAVAPWWLYARAHEPTLEQRAAHGGSIAYSYSQLIKMKRGGLAAAGEATIAEVAQRIPQNIAGILSRDIGAILMPTLYRGPGESGQEVVSVGGADVQFASMGNTTGTTVVSCALALLLIAGWFSVPSDRLGVPVLLIAATVGIVSLVATETIRYVVPLAPFLALFFWRGVAGIAHMLTRNAEAQLRAARVALLCVAGLHVADHGIYIGQKLTGTPEWVADAAEIDEVLTWMTANLQAPGAVASNNPGLVYLRTGRRAVAADNLQANWERWRGQGVRYVVSLRRAGLPRESLQPRLLYRTSRKRLWIVEN